jgi:hypothetical protein
MPRRLLAQISLLARAALERVSGARARRQGRRVARHVKSIKNARYPS